MPPSTAAGYYLDSQDINSGIVDQPSNVGGRGIVFLTNDPAASKDESGFVHVNYRLSSLWATLSDSPALTPKWKGNIGVRCPQCPADLAVEPRWMAGFAVHLQSDGQDVLFDGAESAFNL